MRVHSETVDDVAVVKVKGSIDVVTRSQLKEAECLYSAEHDVVFVLSEVDFLDSSGLSSLVQIIRRFRDSDKDLVLAAPPTHVLNVLQMTSIDQIVPVVGSLEEAIARIKESRDP